VFATNSRGATADDLPLNVSRETLQSTKFLKTLKHIILKRIIKIFGEIADEDPAKYKKIWEAYGTALKLGGVEDYVYKAKLAGLARFNTNQRDFVSLNEVHIFASISFN
jgi:heat shock protein 90kDa beta